MDFDIPEALKQYLATLDSFIEAEIRPLEQVDDNIRFFDHRREWARTDFDRDGLPRREWEALLRSARQRADEAGHYRFALPKEYGGQDGSNLWMAVIREHLAAKGLGLHNDLQNEHSIVGNHPIVLIFRDFGTSEQKAEFIPALLNGSRILTFGLTEPDHGSDATHMETRAVPETLDGREGWRINGEKMWTTGMHVASHCMLFARTEGKDGDAAGITCFLVPADDPGVKVEEYLWTFNMPTDHPRVSFRNVWVPSAAMLGSRGNGLAVAQHFVHENRIRQAASSLGAAVYCIEESVKYARLRKPFGQALAHNQGIQWPLVELATQAEMLRLLIRKTAWEMDQMPKPEVERRLSHKVSMCNYWANRLCCEAADRAMQVHGGIGYSRHKPFEHIYRHHRRYRITEGSEEIQMRKVAAYLFGFLGPRRKEFLEMEQAYARAKAAKKPT
jgi:acyl-CoA dehydrogenase